MHFFYSKDSTNDDIKWVNGTRFFLVWHTGIDDWELGTVLRWGWFEVSVKLALTWSFLSMKIWGYLWGRSKTNHLPKFSSQSSCSPSHHTYAFLEGKWVRQQMVLTSPFHLAFPCPWQTPSVTGLKEMSRRHSQGLKEYSLIDNVLKLIPGPLAPPALVLAMTRTV